MDVSKATTRSTRRRTSPLPSTTSVPHKALRRLVPEDWIGIGRGLGFHQIGLCRLKRGQLGAMLQYLIETREESGWPKALQGLIAGIMQSDPDGRPTRFVIANGSISDLMDQLAIAPFSLGPIGRRRVILCPEAALILGLRIGTQGPLLPRHLAGIFKAILECRSSDAWIPIVHSLAQGIALNDESARWNLERQGLGPRVGIDALLSISCAALSLEVDLDVVPRNGGPLVVF